LARFLSILAHSESVCINFFQSKDCPPSSRYMTLSSRAPQERMGKLSPS